MSYINFHSFRLTARLRKEKKKVYQYAVAAKLRYIIYIPKNKQKHQNKIITTVPLVLRDGSEYWSLEMAKWKFWAEWFMVIGAPWGPESKPRHYNDTWERFVIASGLVRKQTKYFDGPGRKTFPISFFTFHCSSPSAEAHSILAIFSRV